MNEIIAKLRQRYRPERIGLLLVAESPPESHDEKVRFFYNPRQERFDHLYRSVMKALFPEFDHHPGEKDHWLRRFQRYGYFLIDATDQPVNHLQPAARRRILAAAVADKISEISDLVSQETPIVLIKKNIFAAFSRPLREAGHNVVHDRFLPFPSHSHQARFIEEFRESLRHYRERAGHAAQQGVAADLATARSNRDW